MLNVDAISFRYEPTSKDRESVREIVEATGFFYSHEVSVAVELVDERLAKGVASGYHFVFAELDGQLLGYTCYGPIPCTATSFDLYWIAVHPLAQRGGIGRRLMVESEKQICANDGERIYLDTSSRPQYEPTRMFYERCGFRVEAVLRDFYARGDDKVIFVKEVRPQSHGE